MKKVVNFPSAAAAKHALETLAVEWLQSGLATAYGWKSDAAGGEHLLILGDGQDGSERLIAVACGFERRHFIAFDRLGLVVASGSLPAVVNQLTSWASGALEEARAAG